jgi:hypothetical protein
MSILHEFPNEAESCNDLALPNDHELEHVGSILGRVLGRAFAEPEPWDYELCPHCHRASWAYVEWMIEEARHDERRRIEWDLDMADLAGSQRQIEIVRQMLKPKIQYRPQLRVEPR